MRWVYDADASRWLAFNKPHEAEVFQDSRDGIWTGVVHGPGPMDTRYSPGFATREQAAAWCEANTPA